MPDLIHIFAANPMAAMTLAAIALAYILRNV